MEELAGAAFVAAAGAHAGFQAMVTAVAYPTLSHVRAAHWRQAHDRHSKAIAPVVAVVYLAVVATAVWWLVADRTPWAVVAVALSGAAMLVTALVAAPLHRRLVKRNDAALTRLLAADRLRTALAVASVAAALLAIGL